MIVLDRHNGMVSCCLPQCVFNEIQSIASWLLNLEFILPLIDAVFGSTRQPAALYIYIFFYILKFFTQGYNSVCNCFTMYPATKNKNNLTTIIV